MALAIFRSAAEIELKEAFLWYEEREPGLGTEFMRSVDGCVQLILRHPEIYPVVHKNVRQAVLRRFPYSIFYLVTDQAIIVISIFHASRNPLIWKRRARLE